MSAAPAAGSWRSTRTGNRSTHLESHPYPGHGHPPAQRPSNPDPVRLARLLCATWLEVRAGTRPFVQLEPLLAPALRRRLVAQLSPRRRPGRDAARVVDAFACHPRPGACEASVLVRQSGRLTAYAVRLELHRGAWRAVELTAPEAGLRPLPTASLPHDAPLRDAFDETADPFVDGS